MQVEHACLAARDGRQLVDEQRWVGGHEAYSLDRATPASRVILSVIKDGVT